MFVPVPDPLLNPSLNDVWLPAPLARDDLINRFLTGGSDKKWVSILKTDL